MGTVYYYPGNTYRNISSLSLKLYVCFQKITSEPIEYCDFVDPQGRSCISPYQDQNNVHYLQIQIVKVSPQRNSNIVVPTVCAL